MTRVLRAAVPQASLLVVGVSGGPDSLCLLHALCHGAPALGLRLHVAHLNHGLRGEEADEDARAVAVEAARLGLPVTVERAHLSPATGPALEERAREARYRFLAGVVEATGAWAAAVGHTADDQVETVLLNLVRGAGLRGLGGMHPLTSLKWPGGEPLRVVRPLLRVTRTQTEAFCGALGLSPRYDSTNADPGPRRNLLRLQVIPLLRQINPRLDQAIARTAGVAAGGLQALEEQAARLLARAADTGNQQVIHILPLATANDEVLTYALIEWWRRRTGLPPLLQSSHLGSLRRVLWAGRGEASLPRSWRCVVESGTARLELGPPGQPAVPGEQPLAVPGATAWGPWEIVAEAAATWPSPLPRMTREAWLDLDCTGTDLLIRARRPGDRFVPLGMKTPKSLQNFLVDARVPRSQRDQVPLVLTGDAIVWVAGWRVDERFRLRPDSRRALHLYVQPGE